MSAKKQIALGGFLGLLTTGLTVLVNFLLTPFLINKLGPAEYGIYILIGSLIGYISVLDFGLNNTIVRYVSKYRALNDFKSQSSFLSTCLLLYVGISFLVIGIGVIISSFLPKIFAKSLSPEELDLAVKMFWILLFNIAITLPGGTFKAIINGYESFSITRIISAFQVILRFTCLYLVISFHPSAIYIVIIDTVINILAITYFIFYSFHKLKIRIGKPNIESAFLKIIGTYSFWIFLGVIIDQLYWRSGQMILGVTSNSEEITTLAIVLQIARAFITISIAISSLFLPRAMQLITQKASNKELTNEMLKVAQIQIIILFPVLLGFLFWGKNFITIWVGAEYNIIWGWTLLLLSVLILPLAQSFGISILQAKNKHSIRSIVYLAVSILNVLLGIWAAKNFGAKGIVYSMSICFFIGNVVFINFFYWKKIGLQIPWFFFKIFKKWIIPSIGLIACGFVLNNLLNSFTSQYAILVVGITSFFIIYSLFVWVFILEKKDKKSIKKIIHQQIYGLQNNR